jgi:predicted enzyme related to lactoylglutathione lyase
MTIDCACCGDPVEEASSVHLHRQPDIKICFNCLQGLNGQRDRKMRTRMGGWTVNSFDCIFTVADMPRTVDHYEKLGFDISHHDEGYAFAERAGKLNIHLQLSDETGPHPGGSTVYLHTDDADEIADEWRKAGLEVTGPENYDYGKYEGTHVDPDGNVIRFGSPGRG